MTAASALTPCQMVDASATASTAAQRVAAY